MTCFSNKVKFLVKNYIYFFCLTVLLCIFLADQTKNVLLTANTTSIVCTGTTINFTCTAEANPPVHTYMLYENDTVIENMGISGTWLKTVENAGQFVYRCEANNSIQGIGKGSDTILTVDGKSVIRSDHQNHTQANQPPNPADP